MAHTPKPWTLGSMGWMQHREGELCYAYRSVHGGDFEIARVWEDEDDDEMACNARLVEAAPELLEVCRNLVDSLVDWCELAHPEDARDEDYRAIAEARAIIEKVERGN